MRRPSCCRSPIRQTSSFTGSICRHCCNGCRASRYPLFFRSWPPISCCGLSSGDRPHRIVFRYGVVKKLGEQTRLAFVLALDKALHQEPPTQSIGIVTQPTLSHSLRPKRTPGGFAGRTASYSNRLAYDNAYLGVDHLRSGELVRSLSSVSISTARSDGGKVRAQLSQGRVEREFPLEIEANGIWPKLHQANGH